MLLFGSLVMGCGLSTTALGSFKLYNYNHHEIALRIFKRIQLNYPNLKMEIDKSKHPYLELSMDIPEQEGLKFSINVNLQNNDELHLQVGKLWMCWFPCSSKENEEDFFDVVKGLIDGKYRILETVRSGKVRQAKLQKPVNGQWVLKSSGLATFKLPSLKRKSYNIIQNN